VNFVDLDGATPERVKAAYSREDWARLVELKDRRDPRNIFRFNRNIPPSSVEVAV
jgi:FAD/FMN-containing dehydrogenase